MLLRGFEEHAVTHAHLFFSSFGLDQGGTDAFPDFDHFAATDDQVASQDFERHPDLATLDSA
ncbi:MAG: hypothetical protein SNJ84_01300, partial [Verrucomicrobiia bacterium]